MAIRTAAAAAVDADIAQLVADLKTYLALQQTTSPGDAPAVLFWHWLIGQLQDVDPSMAQAIRTANIYDQTAWGKTLSQVDTFA